jgi:hypothetical protein
MVISEIVSFIVALMGFKCKIAIELMFRMYNLGIIEDMEFL